MKRLAAIGCVLIGLTGCADKAPVAPPSPVNGLCGRTPNVCHRGDPSGTNDTTAPFNWTCRGRFGGSNAPCSLQTTPLSEGEVFAGQNDLEAKVKTAGPLDGLYTIIDWTVSGIDCEPHCDHAASMEAIALGMGIPDENLHVAAADNFTGLLNGSKRYGASPDPETLGSTRVFSIPLAWATVVSEADIDIVRRHDFLVVAAAMNTDNEDIAQNRRDMWYPDHPHWEDWGDWDRSMRAFETGKVIIAKHVFMDHDGTIMPVELQVKCGLAKDFCYSVFGTDGGTSKASVQLGALSYYLSQLWQTPREVVGVLNTCAEDVGDPGIDEEFGRGVVSVICDTVQRRERVIAASSMRTSDADSPVLNQMIAGDYATVRPSPQSLAPRSFALSKRFRPFYAVRGYTLETATGYVGGQISLDGADLFFAGGADYDPLGVRSSLLRTTIRTPFMEVGAKRTLFSRTVHGVSFLGSYGRSAGNSMSVNAMSFGGQYGYRVGQDALLSIYGGHRLAYGSIGIPGYRQAGAEPVPYVDHLPEARVSFMMRW